MTLIYTSKFFHPFSHTFDSSVKFVGPSILPRPEVPEFPYDELTGDRLIYISLGTLFTNHLEFFRACVEAFGNSKYQVVMSIGRNVVLAILDLSPPISLCAILYLSWRFCSVPRSSSRTAA